MPGAGANDESEKVIDFPWHIGDDTPNFAIGGDVIVICFEAVSLKQPTLLVRLKRTLYIPGVV